MVQKDTKVSYTAVARFAPLKKDLAEVLATIQAIKAAQKDLNKATPARSQAKQVRTNSIEALEKSKLAQREKAEMASTARRIKRLDKATDLEIQQALRKERALNNAASRRKKRADQEVNSQINSIKRIEKLERDADSRRNKRAANKIINAREEARLANLIATNTEKERSNTKTIRQIGTKSKAQTRAKEEERLQRALDLQFRESEIKRTQIVKTQAKIRHDEELAASKALNNEMLREASAHSKEREKLITARYDKERQVLRDAAAEKKLIDKRQAADLERELTNTQHKLATINRRASQGNISTKDKVSQGVVRPSRFVADSKSDKSYYEQKVAFLQREIELTKKITTEVDREVRSRGILFRLLASNDKKLNSSGSKLTRNFRTADKSIKSSNTSLGAFARSLDRIGRWRPRLIPPFIVLVPAITAILGLMNPLVAGLGAVSAMFIGLASSIGSLGGAAIGVIPALVSLLSVAAALKMAFGGIGNVFKAADKASKRGGGGGGGGGAIAKEELTQTEKIERAQERYRRAIEDVQLATEALDKSKKDYINRLKDVEKQVNRVRMSEARAAANAQLAVEAYYNVMADPGSTKGQKMDAFVDMEEAKTELEDVKKEAKDLAKELADMKKKGIKGDDAVRNATRRLTDAIWAQRDAQLDLANAYKDTGAAAGGASGGVDEFAEAMAELSPSAQEVVKTLLAMKPAWEDVQEAVQEAFFSEIVDDVGKLVKIFPALESLLTKTAGAMGRVASKGIDLVTSNKWIRDLNLLGEQNVPIIENIGDGMLALLDAMLDIAIAAGPFTEMLTKGFKEGAENFGRIVSNARETGSMAKWLGDVADRLAQWWRIIKNIGATLFNYSSASQEFGQWLTDGLENITKGWVKASEESKKAGSSFKQFLEAVKPALSSLKSLFATFFKWFAKEAAEPANIKSFSNIIDMITDDLGPALAEIFDVLRDTEAGESLLGAIIQILETFGEFLRRGGAEGIKSFFTTINDLFATFSAILDKLPDEAIEGIATFLMTISALRFFGITTLITSLVSLAANASVLKGLFKAIPSLDKAGKGAKLGVDGAKPGAPVAVGKGTASSGNLVKNAAKIGKFAGALGVVIAAGEALANVVSGGVDVYEKTKAGDLEGAQESAFVTGAKWTMSPAVGLGVGIVDMLFPGAETEFDNFLKDINRNIVDFVSRLPGEVANFGKDIWRGLGSFNGWLGEQWDKGVQWFVDLPTNVGKLAGGIWANVRNFGDWLGEQWDNAVTWFENLPANIASLASDIWKNTKTFGSWLGEQWTNAVNWVRDLPYKISNAVGDIWRNVKSLISWLGEQWNRAVTWVRELPGRIAGAASNLWGRLPSLLNWAIDTWNGARNFFADLPNKVRNTVGDIFAGVVKNFTAGFNVEYNETRNVTTNRRYGGMFNGGRVGPHGVQHFNRGGEVAYVPGMRANSDTVPTMLTPGEVILNKKAVERAGGHKNLLDFNYGRKSFGDLLAASAYEGATGFFDGGVAGGNAFGSSSGRSAVPELGTTNKQAEASVVDNRITIEKLEVNNPSSEPTEESLAQVIRNMTALRG